MNLDANDLKAVVNLIASHRLLLDFLANFGFDNVDETKVELKKLLRKVLDAQKELESKAKEPEGVPLVS